MPSGNNYIQPMQDLAREAGALLMSFFGKVSIEYKGDADLVTKADRASEKLIVERIRQQWPDHDLIGEEGSRRETGSDYRWHIDPLDGTTNFAHGYPVFCVSMALEYKGERIAGVVYDPTRDEMFQAEAGSGAFLNQQPIHVTPTARIDDSLSATGFPSRKRHQNINIYFYYQLAMTSHGVRRAGAAAIDLAYVACGRLDFFWEFQLKPWDMAAGCLLVREAGGVCTDMRGAPLDLNGPHVLADNGALHAAVVELFGEIFAGKQREPLPQ